MYRDIPRELRELIEPIVEAAGLELVDAQLRRGGSSALLRVTIDAPDGSGRVPIGACAEISREIGSQLDAADAIPHAYQLEVTSPGLDRCLAREKDFAAACGAEVQLETSRPLQGRRRFRGRLLDFDGRVARLEVDGEEYGIPFEEVSKAKRIYAFSRTDFQPMATAR